MTRILTKPPMDKFQAAIFAETQLIQTELKNSLGDRVDQNALADTIGFFTNLAPIRRTTFKKSGGGAWSS